MQFDLINVETKANKKPLIIILILLAISIILVCIIINIIVKINKNKIAQEDEARKNDYNMLRIAQELPKVKYMPDLSIEARERINNIYKSETKRAFLTFDDGPSSNVTPLILDVLKANNIKATFFVLGSRVDLNGNIIKRAYNEGHYIANHGYSHVYSRIYENEQKILDEYYQCEYSIRTALEEPEYVSHLFRFPGGSNGGKYEQVKKNAINLLSDNSVSYLDWNALTGDSTGKNTKEELMEDLINTVGDKNSVVILMHDTGDKILTYETLQDVINYLTERGYSFCSFYDIMDRRSVNVQEEV